MRVILVPGRLRLAAIVLFACVPLAAIETVIVTRAPWWKLPYRSMSIWSGAVFLLIVPLMAWLMRGRVWTKRTLEILFCVWLGLNAWTAVRTRNPALGFFTLFLLALFAGWVAWIRHELRRSFFDPRMKWYQGLPRPLPGLTCKVMSGDQEVECQVSRLDREGTFVFRAPARATAPLQQLKANTRSELTFGFRERTVRCTGLPVRALDGDQGAGFQFDGLSPDLRKQLGDFIETLRGEGYGI